MIGMEIIQMARVRVALQRFEIFRRVRIWLAAIVVALLSLSNSAATFADDIPELLKKAQQDRVEAIARASATTVGVFGPGSRGGGSGVVISADGYALTNFHVVQSCDAFMKCSMNDGVLYDAVIVGIDPVGDVALIKLLGRDDFPFATMADSDLSLIHI